MCTPILLKCRFEHKMRFAVSGDRVPGVGQALKEKRMRMMENKRAPLLLVQPSVSLSEATGSSQK